MSSHTKETQAILKRNWVNALTLEQNRNSIRSLQIPPINKREIAVIATKYY